MRNAQSNSIWIAVCLVILKFKIIAVDPDQRIQPMSVIRNEGESCTLDVYGNSSITGICHEALICTFDEDYNYPKGICSRHKYQKFDDMYCRPSNRDYLIDFGRMGYMDIEDVKIACSQHTTCKAYYEAYQDGKKSYFGCFNTYKKTTSISHVLYVKEIPHYFTSNLRNIKGVEDGRVEIQLECEKDTAKVTWLTDGSEIKPDGKRIQVFEEGNKRRLVITKATIGDSGEIKARTNVDQRSCYLEVKSPIPTYRLGFFPNRPPPSPETPGCWIYLPNECPANSENRYFPSGTDYSKWLPIITPENKEESCEAKTIEYGRKCQDAGALFKFVVTCGIVTQDGILQGGTADNCKNCPELYGEVSCSGDDCGYLNDDTCVKKECIDIAEPIPQRVKIGEMKPDLLIRYNTTPYYFYEKVDGLMQRKEEKQELYFISTKKGETFTEILSTSSNELIFNQYQLDDEYKITSNMHVCNQTLSFRTSFALEICYQKNTSRPILYEDVCDRYNDCDQCDCGCPSCDCTKGDESEMRCKGKVRTAFLISLAYYFVMMILGCLSFWLVKSYTKMENMMDENATNGKVGEGSNVNILIDESTQGYNERNTIQKEVIEQLNKIVKEEDGLEKQFVLDNLSNFRDLNKKIGNINCKSSAYLNILKVTYTLSHNQRYERECNKIVHMLYINEYEVHKNRARALKCLIGSKEELSYLSAWIYKVVDQNSVFDEGNDPSKFARFITQLPFYAFPMFCLGIFYLDITKDIAATYFFFHIFANILRPVYYESRYESVGELNFERLFYYQLAIIITSVVLIYLRVFSKGIFENGGKDGLHKIFNTENTRWRFLVYIFPIHFCLLEQGYLNYKVYEAQQYIKRIDQYKKKNDNVSLEIMKTSRKLEIYNQRLHFINHFYAEIDIIETCFERSPQLVVQTVLFIIANYYSRVLYLFDELLFVPINYIFVLNWFSTVYSISNSILRFRNAKRFPLSTAITGTILQKAAMFVWISAKIVFISVALSNMPYLHPIGPIFEITFVFFIHLLVSRCKPTHSLYTTVGIATTSAFYRPPTRTTKTLRRRKAESPDPDQDLFDEEADSEQSPTSSCCRKKKPNNCSKILEQYMSLRRNGGILSTIMLEALSLAIYFGIGKLVRYLRKQEILEYEIKIRDHMNEKNKEQDIFRQWFELVFVNVNLTYIAVVIAILFGLFGLYLGVVFLYYKFGHPKHLIINKLIENEPEEKIVNNLWEHLDLSPPSNKDNERTNDENEHLNA